MAGNSFGKIFCLTTFGESHGKAIGGIVDGCPAGLEIAEDEIQRELDLRKPGSGPTATKRNESDKVQLLSGIFEGRTTGTPIGFIIANEDQRSRDYGNLAKVFRPGHADYSYFCKYNGIRDYRGGGRASGRETACRVVAGAIAKKLLARLCNGKVDAAAIELAGIAIKPEDRDFAGAMQRPFYAASDAIIPEWAAAVEEARKKGDTLGGIVEIKASHIPAGLGEPVFDKLDALLAYAIMSIGAVKGVEMGSGFEASRSTGQANNDPMQPGESPFVSNHAGGILGGISTGQEIVLRAAIKPIASIAISQKTIDTHGKPAVITVGGRHDLSAIPRVVPVLSAMTALTLVDALLLQKRMELLP